MPATYAHHRFGERLLPCLQEPFRTAAEQNRSLYDVGQHGPDFLFYYQPLKQNPISDLGYAAHTQSGRTFFAQAAAAVRTAADRQAALAYAAGLLCHFALDSLCHSYVEKKMQQSGREHTEIEGEFERYLLEQDGLHPQRQVLTVHIRPTPENGAVIAPFFPPLTAEQAEQALHSMISFNKLLRAPGRCKRGLIYGVLWLCGKYRPMHGMVIPYRPLEACRDSNLRLEKLSRMAEPLALRCMAEFATYVRGEGELGADFDRTFEANPGWEALRVLPYEQELTYDPAKEMERP